MLATIDGVKEQLPRTWIRWEHGGGEVPGGEVRVWIDVATNREAVLGRPYVSGRWGEWTGAYVRPGDVRSDVERRVAELVAAVSTPAESPESSAPHTESTVTVDTVAVEAPEQETVEDVADEEDEPQQPAEPRSNLAPFLQVYKRAVRCNLSTTAKLVAVAIGSHLGRHDGEWVTFVGPRTLSTELALSRATVYRALREVEASGIFIVLRGGSDVHGKINGRSYGTTIYKLSEASHQ